MTANHRAAGAGLLVTGIGLFGGHHTFLPLVLTASATMLLCAWFFWTPLAAAGFHGAMPELLSAVALMVAAFLRASAAFR